MGHKVRTIIYLLQLNIVEIASNHQLEDREKLTVGDEPVTVNVVNLKGNYMGERS